MPNVVSSIFSQSTLNLSVYGNTLYQYGIALAVALAAIIGYKVMQRIISNHLQHLAQKTKSDIDEVALEMVESVRWQVAAYAGVFAGAMPLAMPEFVHNLLIIGFVILIIHQVIVTGNIFIKYLVAKRIAAEDTGQAQVATHAIGLALQIGVWSLGLLFILSNFGIDVTSLIAALGVGGIAIAFALQQILSDLFGSFAIYFDKPFVPGDFVVVGNQMGTVEKIGIKTTRIKSLAGEELVFSNQQLTTATIQNYQRMNERRVVFEIKLTYNTSVKKLKQAVEIIRQAIIEVDPTRLDRVHFKQFAESSLAIEAVYYCETPDYNTYMDVNQDIMLTIKDKFEKEKIELALPTQTIHTVSPAK